MEKRSAKGPIWQRIGNTVMGWLNPPWKPTAAALTAFVVGVLFYPVLQAMAIEFRNALINPLSEKDTFLRQVAIIAHRAIFIDIFALCEAILIGATCVVTLNFSLFVAGRIRKAASLRRRERARRAHRERRPEPVRLVTPRTPDSGVA